MRLAVTSEPAQDDDGMSVHAPTLRARNTQIDEIAFCDALACTGRWPVPKPRGPDGLNERRTGAECALG
jgi:hypothetical protein